MKGKIITTEPNDPFIYRDMFCDSRRELNDWLAGQIELLFEQKRDFIIEYIGVNNIEQVKDHAFHCRIKVSN